MAIRLIAMDLDGTLLNSDKLISARTFAALQRAQKLGVKTTIATGRMFLSAEYFGRQIAANAPLICCNGGMVQEMGGTRPLFAHYLQPAVVQRLLTLCHERGWYVQWYIGNDILAEDFRPEYFQAYRTVKNFRVREVGSSFLDYTEKVLQCVVRDGHGQIDAVVAELQQHFTAKELCPQQNTAFSVDLTPPMVDKSVGLSALADSLGITPAEIMACGDADNDLAMLRYAGTSVVPANGLPQARELASFLTDSCDDDGIARAIEELVLH